MRITYYTFPEAVSVRERVLIIKQVVEGRTDFTEVPADVRDEVLEKNFPETIDTSVSVAKKLMKAYGGSACTCHFDRDGGLFETTAVTLKGNNSRHKYNRHL